MAQPLESLARRLPRAAVAAVAATSTAAARRVGASDLAIAATSTSTAARLVGASDLYELLASDSTLAALRVITVNAARRAANHAVVACTPTATSSNPACTPTTTSAARARAASDHPSWSSIFAWYARCAAAPGDLDALSLPPSAARARMLPIPSDSSLIVPTAAAARLAVKLAELGTLPHALSPLRSGRIVTLDQPLALSPLRSGRIVTLDQPLAVMLHGADEPSMPCYQCPALWGPTSLTNSGMVNDSVEFTICPFVMKLTTEDGFLLREMFNDKSSVKCPLMLNRPRRQYTFYGSSAPSYSGNWIKRNDQIAFPFFHSADVHELIYSINELALNQEDELLFRNSFNERFQNVTVADILCYLENHEFSFTEWRHILETVYRKIGPHKELMELLIKEGIQTSSSDEERNQSPIQARVESKVDVVLKRLDERGALISEILEKSKSGDLTKLLSILLSLFG